MRWLRRVGMAYGLMLAAQAGAQGMAPDTAAEAAAANRRIRAANDAIARGNADRLATWEAERARVAGENAASKAAFAEAQAAHARDMANWRAETARLAQAAPDRGVAAKPARARNANTGRVESAAAGKRICRNETVTGSLVQKRKVCTTAAERNATARDAQGTLRGMTNGGCTPGLNC